MNEENQGVTASPPGSQATPEAPVSAGSPPSVSIPNADYADSDFARGAQVCREMMARFVEQGGDATTAGSIRANWHPGWGDDPGVPPEVLDTWEAPECPEGEANYAEYCKTVPPEDDRSAEGFLQTAKMLEAWAIPMFPANRKGQIPFVRCMIECAIRDLRAASGIEGEAGDAEERLHPEGESPAPKGDAQ